MPNSFEWDAINAQIAKEQPYRNQLRLWELQNEQKVQNSPSLEGDIKHQKENMNSFKAPREAGTHIEFSPRMQEFFGITPEGDKLNKEMTVPPTNEPHGMLDDYLNGVVNRVVHPLEAASTAVQEWSKLPPEEQAMSLVSPVGGLVGTFIGKSSKLFSPMEKELAMALHKAGESPQGIKQITNMSQDAAGVWKSEISDVGMKMKLPDLITLSNGAVYRESNFLSDVIHHPELSKAYPGLMKNYDFVLQEGSGQSSGSLTYPLFSPEGRIIKKGTLTVNRPKDVILNTSEAELDSIKRTAIHEIGHSIQKLEGWQGGANYFTIEKKMIEEAQWKNLKEGIAPLNKKEITDIQKNAYLEYLRHAGEVEARLASMRSTMSLEELKTLHPQDMGEIHPSNQILR